MYYNNAMDEQKWLNWQENIKNCRRCGLCETRTQSVCGNRNYAARIAMFGEAPGRDEDIQGVPFCGRAGALLDDFLAGCGIDKSQLYIGNTVKCRPVEQGVHGYRNRKPAVEELAACRKHLLEELELLQPRLVITLGAVPLGFFLGRMPVMSQLHGKKLSSVKCAAPVYAMYHPAALIYDQSKEAAYRADLQRLRALIAELGLA